LDESQNPNPDNLKPTGEAAPPLTPAAWLANNAVYLILIGAVVGLIWYKLGLEGVWSISKVVLGLGFVIFIHELGHFLAAKWCDVHVQTFSIGFGPALPGCSFQRGETTYKISVLPLGGYVNMVGEGLEGDEDEDYPRSFKNKTVGQRMLIISAGVIMNVILGCVLFIVVYYYHGVMERPAVVGRVDAGSPLWQKGIPSGALITNLAGVQDPTFKNLQRKVILSSHGEVLPFTFVEYGPDGKPKDERTVGLLPRLEANDQNPVVGVSPPTQLRLQPKPERDLDVLPVLKDSPAAAARPIPVEKDEVVVAATDPDSPDALKEIKHDLKAGTFDYQELSRRVGARKGQKMVVRVLPKGADEKAKPVERDVALEGFQWNDTIVGCTDMQTMFKDTYNPFLVSELPHDPRHPDDQRDPFIFHNRLRQLAGMPIVIQVRRGDPNNTSLRQNPSTGPIVSLFVPPAYHFTFGMRMKMGKVAGVREDSPAAHAEIKKGDEIIKVVLLDEHGVELRTWEDLDPERLPFQLAQEAGKRPGKKKVVLTVRRDPSESDRAPRDFPCKPVEWDDRWDNDEEVPLGAGSPIAIPQLGVAYWVLSQVVAVQPDSPAARAGLKKDDTLKEYRLRELSRISKELGWSEWSKLETEREGNKVYDRWAQPFWYLQLSDYKEYQVKVKRPDEEVAEPITLKAQEDQSWPLTSRGLKLLEDYKLQKADSLGEALVMGGRETGDMIAIMYLQLRSLVTGRVSFKGMAGPIGMGVQGFFIAQSGNFELLLFLGIISINLAVVNFLPIPILDGGHMVFLIYEKLRGRPPAEKVRAIATYIGLAMIGFLMLFVFYQDIQNYVIKKFGG
jgi:membrane-associated protease RseP (regulator of RpoE activity)